MGSIVRSPQLCFPGEKVPRWKQVPFAICRVPVVDVPPDRQYPPFFKVIPGTTRSKPHSFFRVDAYVSHLHTHYLHSPKARDLWALIKLGCNGTGKVTVICRFRAETGDIDGFFTVFFALADTRVPFSHVPTCPAVTEMYAHIRLWNALENRLSWIWLFSVSHSGIFWRAGLCLVVSLDPLIPIVWGNKYKFA